jgi:hypothetical protein
MRTGKLLVLTLLLCLLSCMPLHSEAKEAVILDTDMVDLLMTAWPC